MKSFTPFHGISRRQFIHLGSLTAVSAVVSACMASIAPESGPVQENIQLVYQDWRTDWFPAMAQDMLSQFHDQHPTIRVFYTPDPDNLEEKMLADMQSGTAADVFQGCCTFFPIWAQNGQTTDLQPYVDRDIGLETISEWNPAQYKALALPNGHRFGLPKYHGGLALYYNKNIFDQYGVPYPDGNWTHESYQEAMLRLTHDKNGDGRPDLFGSMVDISWERIQVHVNAWGGHLVDPEQPGRCQLNAQPTLQAMEWIRARMWDDRVMASFLDIQNMETRQAFSSGRVAMVEDGSWALKDILSTADFRIGVAPLPQGPAGKATLATTDGFGIYTGTRHVEAAWKLLEFLTGEAYGVAMAHANFLQPARAALIPQWINFIRSEYPAAATDVDIAAFADGHLKGYSVTAEIAPDMALVSRRVMAVWDRIFTLGEASVDEMVLLCAELGMS